MKCHRQAMPDFCQSHENINCGLGQGKMYTTVLGKGIAVLKYSFIKFVPKTIQPERTGTPQTVSLFTNVTFKPNRKEHSKLPNVFFSAPDIIK